MGDLEFGEVESLKIDVLSETGWFDDAEFKQTMAAHGGSGESQYRIPWRAENAGGYTALITAQLPGGEAKRILLDTGWNTAWMDWVYGQARRRCDAGARRNRSAGAVAGTIFASGAAGCVVHERTVRVAPYPYPVIVGRYPPRPWYAGPKPWFQGCDKRYRSAECHPRYQVDRRDRRHDHHGRFRDFDG